MSASPFSFTSGGSGDFNPSQFPDSPAESLDFAIYAPGYEFTPLYHPERLIVTTEKKLSRTGAGCEGERVSIDTLKNSDLSIVGKMHSADLSDVNNLAEENDPVEVLSPVLRSGGMEAVVKRTERGEILSWDGFPLAEDWLIQYQIDLVSTGRDEYENESVSRFDLGEEQGSAGGSSIGPNDSALST